MSKSTNVFVELTNGAKQMFYSEDAAMEYLKKSQDRYDERIKNGETPRNPRPEIKTMNTGDWA